MRKLCFCQDFVWGVLIVKLRIFNWPLKFGHQGFCLPGRLASSVGRSHHSWSQGPEFKLHLLCKAYFKKWKKKKILVKVLFATFLLWKQDLFSEVLHPEVNLHSLLWSPYKSNAKLRQHSVRKRKGWICGHIKFSCPECSITLHSGQN